MLFCFHFLLKIFRLLFYNPDENAVEQLESPSELLNTSYTHVHAYVRKQYTKIIDDINIITSENIDIDVIDQERFENEPDF